MTAIAVRSPITFASASDIGARSATKIPNQLAPASAQKNEIRNHENSRRLIRRRTRKDLLAVSSISFKEISVKYGLSYSLFLEDKSDQSSPPAAICARASFCSP